MSLPHRAVWCKGGARWVPLERGIFCGGSWSKLSVNPLVSTCFATARVWDLLNLSKTSFDCGSSGANQLQGQPRPLFELAGNC